MSVNEPRQEAPKGVNDSEEMTDIFVECSSCETLFRFEVTQSQSLRYSPPGTPRTEYVQDIFPELPIPALAVLSQGNVCGLCLSQSTGDVSEALKPYIFVEVEGEI